MNPPASLLLVDDDEMNRDMLGRRLELEGYKVTLAEGGRQALGLLEQQPFDVVLLDVMMPETERLAGAPPHPQTSIPRPSCRSSW